MGPVLSVGVNPRQDIAVRSHLNPVAEDLFLIPLTPPLPGFEDFIGAWLYTGGPRFLVDVGPASTAEGLFEYLDRLNVAHLDFILLTHIHLDHAGAIGAGVIEMDVGQKDEIQMRHV